MDIFMPIPTTYAAPRTQPRQDGRTGREDGATTSAPKIAADAKDKEVTGKQSATGRRRAFSGKLQRSKSRVNSRSRSRTRTKKQGTTFGDNESETSATGALAKTASNGSHSKDGIAIGIIGRAITALAMPMEGFSVDVGPPRGPEGAGGKQLQGDLSSPSREAHDREKNQNQNQNTIITGDSTNIPTTICAETRSVPASVGTPPLASPLSTSNQTINDKNNKPLATLPEGAPRGDRGPVVDRTDVELDPASAPEIGTRIKSGANLTATTDITTNITTTTTTPTRDRRGTNTSSPAFVTTTTAVPVIAVAAAAGRPRAASSSHPGANGIQIVVDSPRTQLPAASSSHRSIGIGIGIARGISTGAGAGARITASRISTTYLVNRHAAMVPDPSNSQNSFSTRSSTSAAFRRTGSVSSASVSASGTTHSHRTGVMTSSEHLPPPSSIEGSVSASNLSANSNLLQIKPAVVGPKPLIIRNGRTYIHDEHLPYPLPVDLAELNRQSLRTLLLFQLFGGPIISTAFSAKPPQCVLEVGCGSGFWSMMCHRFFAQHGHSDISFTGVDIVPLCGTGPNPNSKPDKEMNWRFVQHDMRRTPWPFQDGEFDLVMVKDMSSTAPGQFSQVFMDEYLRILRPGGVLEIWETDMSMRMLRPHVPAGPAAAAAAAAAASAASAAVSTANESESESEDEDDATRLGVYVVSANTPLSAPLNQFLVEYNGWLSKALDKRYLSAVPCTMIGPMLVQEDGLTEVRSKRLAVPLSEVRWEREGVGGVVTKDGKSYIDSMKGKGKAADSKAGKGGKALTAVQAAIRRTALETSVDLIQALEPMLRDVSGKSQDEWDGWTGKMMNDLLRDGGTSWGECLEIGAWSARRTKD